jgi:hypothetical protein
MRVRDWQDILADVVERDVDPQGWRAVGGDRARGVGEDMFVGHPGVGVFQLKTFAKNPFEVQGVGTRVAQTVDEDLDDLFPEPDVNGRFAVQGGVEDEADAERKANHLQEVMKAHAEAPTGPGDFFDDAMEALDSPAFGPMDYDQYDRPGPLDDLATTFEDAEEILEAEFEELVDEGGIGRGFQ